MKLAFLGDAVFELMVRSNIVSTKNISVNDMHSMKTKYVCSKGQSDAITLLEGVLTPQERDIYKRGRNSNSGTVPKNSGVVSYRRATGLEALFGYLYLNQDICRINELFDIIWNQLNIDSSEE